MFRDLLKRHGAERGPVRTYRDAFGGVAVYGDRGPVARGYDDGDGRRSYYDGRGPLAREHEDPDGSRATFFDW